MTSRALLLLPMLSCQVCNVHTSIFLPELYPDTQVPESRVPFRSLQVISLQEKVETEQG